ncbi:Gfo/Idh/MocA family oxidoreductase [Leucobacter sp. gxy201]|uniref:Gfo/Idh/MocA family protein n=1 Tax=Leucobacter sp. gxy201 TaxID=2957200 RepID=UPI003D9FE8DC
MNPNTSTPRVAVVGAGSFGSLHIGALSRLHGCELVALCEPNERVAAGLAEKYGIPRTYTALDQLLETEELDAVFLTIPEHLHVGFATKVINRGIDCFIEKPLALTAAEGQQLIDLAAEKQVILQVGHILRFEAQHAILYDSVVNGALGEVMTIRAKRNAPSAMWETSGKSAHIAMANLVHDVDQILWMSAGQRAVSIRAYERNFTGHEFPDCVVATIEMSGGTLAMVEASWSVPSGAPANIVSDQWRGRFDASLEVVGTTGTGHVQVYESGLEIWGEDASSAPNSALWPEIHGAIGGALRDELANFLDRISGRSAAEIVSLPDAVHGLEILEAIVESARTGTEVRL